MQDLVKIIKWRDEVREIEYVLVKLELAEELAVQEENYEKAQLMLLQQDLKLVKHYCVII